MNQMTVEELNTFELLSMLMNLTGGMLMQAQIDTLIALCTRYEELDRLVSFALGDDERLAFLIAQIAVMRAQISSRTAR
jgi:hypothetical protein